MAKEEKLKGSGLESPSESIEGDITLLKQLLDALDDAVEKLQEFYRNNDVDSLNKTKKFILNLKSKISEVLE